MFGPDWGKAGCPSCSYVADNFAGSLVHLAACDTAFAVISRAPFEKIKSFMQRMGWTFPWLSSFGTDFNYDFGVTLDGTHTIYNYAPVSAQPKGRPREGEREGLSVFLRDGDRLFHTYSTSINAASTRCSTPTVLGSTIRRSAVRKQTASCIGSNTTMNIDSGW